MMISMATDFLNELIRIGSKLSFVDALILSVIPIGVYLAFSGEGARSLYKFYLGSNNRNSGNIQKKENCGSFVEMISNFCKQMKTAYIEGKLIKLFSQWMNQVISWVYFTFSCYMLQSISQSKRHFFYLIEKKLVNIPIRKGETELESYLDLKRSFGKQRKWPFMWLVSNPRSEKVICEDKECYPMSSYGYLDLLNNEEVQLAAIKAANEYSTGSHGPRMLGGNTPLLRELEKCVAEFFGRDDSLVMATGYMACLSVVAAIYKKGDIIFGDDRLHASIRAGIKVASAKVLFFKHNDMDHLERLVKQHRKKYKSAWLIIESVYSMDGDIAPLPECKKIADQYDLRIIVDEAHGLGVLGATGRGLEEHFDMKGAADIICGTFSKSVSGIGGYITGSQDFADFLDFHTPGNTFSAALPAYSCGGALKALQIIMQEPEKVIRLKENSVYLRNTLKSGGGNWPMEYPDKQKYIVEGDECTSVIAVIFPDDMIRVMNIASSMLSKGWMISAVAFPACPLRKPRFRITGRTNYTKAIIDAFVQDFVKTCVEVQPSSISIPTF